MSDVILGVTCMMSHSVVPVIDEKKKDILKCDAMFALKKFTKFSYLLASLEMFNNETFVLNGRNVESDPEFH